jgi:hypothetical protein
MSSSSPRSSPAAVGALAALGPFAGNPGPPSSPSPPRPGPPRHAKNGGVAHLKLVSLTPPATDSIGFGLGPRLAEVDGPVDLAYQPSLDTWNGRTRVSLKIRDFRAAESAVLSPPDPEPTARLRPSGKA